MNERLKHRMVGAVVLVSLGVVLIPMVLETPANRDRATLSKVTVGAPGGVEHHHQASGIAHRQPPEQHFASSGPVGQGSPTPALRESSGEHLRPAPAEQVRERGFPQAAPALDSKPPIGQKGINGVEVQGTTVSSTLVSPSKSRAWAVQMGSFSKRSNAVALRDRMQARGYSAFISPTAESHGGLTRVYVGPQLSKDQAAKLSLKLSQETQLSGLVVPYP
ncbi:MAG: SPOR domain-containing protein [Gammaproteobacteria bacterium]